MEKGSVEKQAAAFLQSALDAAVTGLRGLGDSRHFWSDEIGRSVTARDKLIAESLVLVLLVARLDGRSPEIDSSLRAICEACVPFVHTAENRILLARYPHVAVAFGISEFVLNEMGHGDAAFGRAVAAAFRSRRVHAVERVPYRTMEVRWLESLLLAERRASFADLLPASILEAATHPLRMSTDDNYAFTHALMYLSDFGNQALPETLDIDRLEALNEQLIAAHIVNENLDVLGELLMSTMFLGRPWSVRARFAWHFLAETWKQFGVLPSPDFAAEEYARLDAKDARAYMFKHSYHTLYVGAILCSLILRRPELAVTQGMDDSLPVHVPLVQVMRLMDECPSLRGLASCQWTKVFEGSAIGQAELSSLLCDGLAAHAAEQYDLVTLCGLLESLQSSGGFQDSTLLSEVRSFLDSQADSGGLAPEVVERIAQALGPSD